MKKYKMKHIIFLIDTSFSMYDKIPKVVDELNDIIDLIKKNKNTDKYYITIANFNHLLYYSHKFVDIDELLRITSDNFRIFGATALYDSISNIMDEFASVTCQTFLFVLTDGEDNSSVIPKDYIETVCYNSKWKIVHFHPSNVVGLSSVQNVIYEFDDLSDLFSNMNI
jgi:uncharacterized protein YegL